MSERKSIPEAVKSELLAECGYKCGVPTCNVNLTLELHHILHVSEGGENTADNILVVCANCHALYHNHHQNRPAVRQWKARLVTLNKGGDQYFLKNDAHALAGRIEQMEGAQVSLLSDRHGGFHHVVSEYMQRGCRIGFLHGERFERFVQTGFGTFIDKDTVLTCGSVFDLTEDVVKSRAGRPALFTSIGMSSFSLQSRFVWGDHAILSVNGPYSSAFAQTKDEEARQALIEKMKPLETPIRARRTAYVGEEVAFLNAPENTKELRWTLGFQMEAAHVSFAVRKMNGDFADAVLTPIFSRVEHAGAGVFSISGELVGVVKDVFVAKEEIGRRIVFSNFLGVKRLGGNYDEGEVVGKK